MGRLIYPLLFLAWVAVYAQPQKGYYRYPAIHGENIVFTSEGDLWKVGVGGGLAQRLTTHPSMEYHAALSPDGQTVAFSARYEGPTEVYTMSIQGGLPKRLTFAGDRALVIGWTPDSKIIYSTNHYSTLPNTQLAILDPESGAHTLVPLNQASQGVFNQSGQTVFFTRLPFQGSKTKRYQGGTAQNLWKFTTGAPEAIPLTSDYPGTSKAAMWWNNRIYFLSDRDGTMNLWSIDENGGDLQQLTFHKGWDSQDPELHNGRIVYQLGADLHLLEIAANHDKKLDISLASDFDQSREKWIDDPMQYFSDLHISPEGDKVAITARGRVFVAPAKNGRFVEATRKQGVRYRNGLFFPDGKSLLTLSDESGELEFWKVPANGLGKATLLTQNGEIFRYEGTISPDGKMFAFTDRNKRLWIHDITAGKTMMIAETDEWGISGETWSPDSRWLAFMDYADNYYNQIKIYSVSEGKTINLTSDRVASFSPAWSTDGKWLYCLSDRHFESLVRSPWGPRQPEPYYEKTTKIYMIALQKGLRSPFQADDELVSRVGKKEKKKDSDEAVIVNIDLDGIQQRVFEVPVEPGNYNNLMVNDKRLFWTETEVGSRRQTNLMALEITNDNPKPKVLVENVRNFDLSYDGKKFAVRKGDNIYVVNASGATPAKLDEAKVDLSNWTFSIDPKEEWRQMFVDAWRLERDYFYDPNMHNVDWQGIFEKHLPLVDRIADRDELNDLIGHVVGELSALHMNVRGGDFREGDEDIDIGSLGAVLVRDETKGGYRIDHIYKSEPDYLDRLSPLARPDVNVSEGDVITAINGVQTLSVAHPNVLLRNQIGQQVRLDLKSMPSEKSFSAIVVPISQRDARNLRYDEWEYTRRLAVDEMGNGDIGYVHMRAMGGGNYSEFVRNFYPVFNRKGLIIDMRHNRGGNIDSWVLEKLMRKAWFYWQPRVGKPYWNMQYAFRGHMVVLCNERTASDGEAFTEGFRRLGLGKVIGTRTWGGEIWLSNNNPLVDWGIARAPQTGVYGAEGKWLIEGWGVEPDIVVDNLPHATFNGKDAQLEAAVAHLQELIKNDPRPVPPHPPYPNKDFDYEKMTNGRSQK